MPRVCFSAGCKSGYLTDRKEKLKNGEKIPSLFTAPKNPELFDLWRKAIPRADRQLTQKDSLCEKHFREEDINRVWETIVNGSTKWQMEMRRPRLKPGTVPCIFSDVPGHSTYMSENKLKKKKSYYKRKISESSVKKKKIKKTSNKINIVGEVAVSEEDNSSNENDINSIELPVDDHENNVFYSQDLQNKQNERCLNQPLQEPFMNHSVTPPFSIDEDLQEKNSSDMIETTLLNNSVSLVEKNESMAACDYELREEQFSFSFLKKTVHLLEKTNLRWSTVVFEDHIICQRWNSDHTLDRKIVILNNLKVKIFLKEHKSNLGRSIRVVSFETLLELIHSVERIRICDGIDNKEANCRGFLQINETNLCYNCKLKNRKKVLQRLKISKDQVELIKFNIVS